MTSEVVSRNRKFLQGVARAFAGALIFALPMLMTMEMWEIGTTGDPMRLALLTAVMLPVLCLLAYFVGFEDTPRPIENVLDACAAYGIAFVMSGAVLALFGLFDAEVGPEDIVGMIAVQAVPASIGALLAQSILTEAPNDEERERQGRAGYSGGLFFMAIGALFLSFNIAPTEEIPLLALAMGPAHALAAVIGSLIVMHAFVYGVEFSGRPLEEPGMPWWSLFGRYTVPGYAVALVTGAAMLWVFGQTDGADLQHIVDMAVVLAVPASVGAAAARLIL